VIGSFLALVLLVNDGDTFKARIEVWPGVEVQTAVRVRGIDTPEIKGKCQSEKDAALRARERLRSLLTGDVSVSNIELDKYAGRVDADVRAGGVNVADVLVAEGLARRYNGGVRQPWCP
jgi:endonuclease YncB( thermonuclease family)